MFDLSSLEAKDTATIDILHPEAGTPIGAKITVYGQDSEIYKAITRKQTNKRLDKLRKNQKGITAEATEEEALDLLVACTKAWEGVGEGGKSLECTPENVRRVYQKYPFIRRQVDEAIVDYSLFIKA